MILLWIVFLEGGSYQTHGIACKPFIQLGKAEHIPIKYSFPCDTRHATL